MALRSLNCGEPAQVAGSFIFIRITVTVNLSREPARVAGSVVSAPDMPGPRRSPAQPL